MAQRSRREVLVLEARPLAREALVGVVLLLALVRVV
jgi:hypothetical protein